MLIKCAEDFGLGFNCLTRMYMRNYDEKYLEMIMNVQIIYLRYFSSRTIVCSLRDFVEGSRFNGGEEIPQSHIKKVDCIIKRLVQYGLAHDKQRSQIRNEEERIIHFGQEIYFCNYWTGESKFDNESFLNWVHANKLNEAPESRIIRKKNTGTLPLKKENVVLLRSVCMTMIEYSYGRNTYMPSTSVSFVKANWENLADDFLREIKEFLMRKPLQNVEFLKGIDDMDNKTWRIFEEDISLEIISRESCIEAKEIGVDGIEKSIVALKDLSGVETQKRCREVIASLDGVRRYIDTANLKDKSTMILKYEEVRAILIEHLHELWKKEEGHLYEEISNGVYIRKKQ